MKIIDADGHILDKEKDVRPFLPESHRRRGGSLVPSLGVDARLGGRFSDIECHDVPKRLKDMDREGIDVSVLFPTSSFAMTKIFERDYAVAYARAYNDYIASVCKATPRLKAVALLPFQNVDAAVREVNRAVTELGLAGVAVAPQGMKEHLGSETYWPIYEEIQRLNVPFCVHSRREGPAGENRFDTFIFMHTIGRPTETIIQCVGLMYAGVPEKFPKLRIAFLECGAGWVPYWMERMDEHFETLGYTVPRLHAKPSEHVTGGRCFVSFEADEALLPAVASVLGDTQLLYASDYPHYDADWEALDTIVARADLTDDQKRRFLGENARRLFTRLAA